MSENSAVTGFVDILLFLSISKNYVRVISLEMIDRVRRYSDTR